MKFTVKFAPALSRQPVVRRSLLMVPLHLISTGAHPRATAMASDVPSARACTPQQGP